MRQQLHFVWIFQCGNWLSQLDADTGPSGPPARPSGTACVASISPPPCGRSPAACAATNRWSRWPRPTSCTACPRWCASSGNRSPAVPVARACTGPAATGSARAADSTPCSPPPTVPADSPHVHVARDVLLGSCMCYALWAQQGATMDSVDLFSVRDLRQRSGDLMRRRNMGICRSSRSVVARPFWQFRSTNACLNSVFTVPWQSACLSSAT